MSVRSRPTMYRCNQCRSAGRDFLTPVDTIGAALMDEHLREHEREQGRPPRARIRAAEGGRR